MVVLLGSEFPNFEAETTIGRIKFHDWIGDSWAVLFSHPADYTPVCTTESGELMKKKEEFAKRNVKLIMLSCDSVEDHKGWSKDVLGYANCVGDTLPFPIIADENRHLAESLGMIDPAEKTAAGLPLTCRAVFIIGPNKKLMLSLLYPATTGRNFEEIIRVIDSLQLTMYKKVATPANWKQGERCMVVPSVKPEEIPALFPKGVEIHPVASGKQYLRFTPQPE